LAAQRPDSVQGLALFAPTLKLDGWGVPWYSKFFALVTQKWFANLIKFSERDPYGIKDPRIRALVTAAIQSGDSSQVGQLANPGGVMLEMRWLINTVKREIPGIKQPTLILHPREDDRASLANAFYLQRHLAGSVEVRVLEDCYHVITLDRQRHVVIECTGAFAARIGGKSAGQAQAETYLRQPVPSAAVAETVEPAFAEGERARHH